ncbi:glycosyltransferase family 4 protein [Perlabentimonas gracilis]|uniref:glycosyltransferase family 4 protein n=1 Tax=Perlabentimonas gracilis TaxID=2715279 RepID=UPI0014075B67|nr:glycosyltransferase family 4 protein [Perlabentimonas gracilis]NHB70200.1 glycosyltransferase family 4 protein [Perlabentimonas gracilis]
MSLKPKVAVIGLKGLPAYGGAAAVGEALINELKGNYSFTVYSTSSHTHLKTAVYSGFKQVVFNKIPFKKLNTLYYYIVSTLHTLIFGKYNLVHLHHRDAAFIIPLLRIRFRVIVTTHNSFVVTDKWKKYEWFFQLNERYFIRFANRVTCVSKNEVRKFKKEINLDVTYIPNGISQAFTEQTSKSKDTSNYIFFGAGRIIRTKALHILLKALHQINYNGKLLIAGDTDQSIEYKKELLELSKGIQTEYLGLIKEKDLLLNYIQNASLFVYPSSLEAMSMMLLEGASVQTPIICSDIIENKDIFSDDEVLFFKVDDYNDLASKITFALNNLDQMNMKAENAYKKLILEYNWEKISLKYAEIYNRLIE